MFSVGYYNSVIVFAFVLYHKYISTFFFNFN